MPRGWRRESRRHALAAKGIKTRQKLPFIYYHGTNLQSARDIKRDKRLIQGTIVKDKNIAKRYAIWQNKKSIFKPALVKIETSKDYGKIENFGALYQRDKLDDIVSIEIIELE